MKIVTYTSTYFSRPFDHPRNKSPSLSSSNLDIMQSSIDPRTSLMNGGTADDVLQQHRGRGPPPDQRGGPPSPLQHPPLLHQPHQNINEITNKHEACDSGWGMPPPVGGGPGNGSIHAQPPMHSNSTSIKDSYSKPEVMSSALPADLFEEDDLGFDPFHETQKALAEMLETESKVVAELQKQQQLQQQQQQQQQNQNQAPHRHLYQHQQSSQIPFSQNQQNPTQQRQNESPPTIQQLRHESPVMNRAPTGNAPTGNNGGGSGNGSGLSGSSSLMAGLRGFNNDLVQQQQQTSVPSTGGLHMNSVSTAQTVAPSGPGRVKQPPPGFDPLSMLNSGTSNGQPSSQRNLLSPGKKHDAFSNHKTIIVYV